MLTREENDATYLDIRLLEIGQAYRGVKAYIHNTNLGTARNDRGFIVFYLRDVNQQVITSRMFNISDFLSRGYTISNLRKRAAIVDFTASQWGGELQLTINDINPYTGKDFDYGKFLHKLPNAPETLTAVNDTLARYLSEDKPKLLSTYATMSYLDVCNGSSGGYVKFAQMVVNSLIAFNRTPGVEGPDLLECSIRCLNAYASYLEIKDRLDIVLKAELFRLIQNFTEDISDVRLRNICVDALSAVLNLAPPEHLYAHIISNAMSGTEKMLQYSYNYPLLVEGSTKRMGDDILARY